MQCLLCSITFCLKVDDQTIVKKGIRIVAETNGGQEIVEEINGTRYVVKDRLLEQSPFVHQSASDAHSVQHELTLPHRLAQQVSQMGPIQLEHLFQIIVDSIEENFGVTCCLQCQPEANADLRFCYVSKTTIEQPCLLQLCSELSNYYYSGLTEGLSILCSEIESLPPEIQAAMQNSQVGSFMLVPLLGKEMSMGEIGLYRCQSERHWTEREWQSVSTIASQCVRAIEQAQSHQHPKTHDLLIRQINQLLNSSILPEQILLKILEKIGNSFAVEQVILFQLTEAQLHVREKWQAHEQSLPLLEQENSCQRQLDLDLNSYLEIVSKPVSQYIDSFDGTLISVPVSVRGQFFGSLVVRTASRRIFTVEEIKIIECIAEQVAIALFYIQSQNCLEKQIETTKTLEAEKQRSEEANRAKSSFLSVMNHELRTPLSGILGFSRMLLDEIYGSLNQKQMQYVSAISESGEYLLELINDLLDISKIEAEKEELFLEKVPVEDICLSSMSLIQERAKQGELELTLDMADGVSFCKADQLRLKQILVNLLSNAVKFTEAGGSVTLRVRQNEKIIQFAVIDTGIGIKPEDQHKLFQPFSQINNRLSRKHKGTGLGLALSKKLAQLHGGDITLVSEEGQGSCFTLHLPV